MYVYIYICMCIYIYIYMDIDRYVRACIHAIIGTAAQVYDTLIFVMIVVFLA